MPIHSAKYLSSNEEIICTGKRKHYYIYNIVANKIHRIPGIHSHFQEINSLERVSVGDGKYAFGSLEGYVVVYDDKSKNHLFDLKINGSSNSIVMENNLISVSGDQSEITIFDCRKANKCIVKVPDEGNNGTICMVLSANGKYLATSTIT